MSATCRPHVGFGDTCRPILADTLLLPTLWQKCREQHVSFCVVTHHLHVFAFHALLLTTQRRKEAVSFANVVAFIADFVFTENGHLLLTTKKGRLCVAKDIDECSDNSSADEPVLAIDLGAIVDPDNDNDNDDNNNNVMCTNGSRGLGSITAHPNFSENGFARLCVVRKRLF